MASTIFPSSQTSLSPSRISALLPSLHKTTPESIISFSYSCSPPSCRTSFTRPVVPSILAGQSRLFCRMNEYKFPDPIPEFAEAETARFREHMLSTLSKYTKFFGDSVEEVVDICSEILSKFLRTEYGGPGTLLVIPFIDMCNAITEKELPCGPQAARIAVVWAQNNIDKDWKEWTGEE